jgi:ubiquinone/menaquinone biosynthesis C-methylase UbiE
VSSEAVDMVFTRYAFAKTWCEGKRVLEIACGAGPGLGFLHQHSASVVAGDYSEIMLGFARRTYGGSIPLLQFDAHELPFRDAAFDTILCFEAIYYFADLSRFLRSAQRVLSPLGTIVIVAANPEAPPFHRSHLSTRYWSSEGLKQALADAGYVPEVFGGFPIGTSGRSGRLFDVVKRAAVTANLIPKTMKSKEWIKRIVFGKLQPFPADIRRSQGTYRCPLPLGRQHEANRFKVLYAVGRLARG